MPGSDLTEAAIRKNASVDSFQDGQQSYQQGRVRELVQRGNVLQAAVDDGMPEPYIVSATFEAGGGAVATCACRYDRSGWCKHIVATLLAGELRISPCSDQALGRRRIDLAHDDVVATRLPHDLLDVLPHRVGMYLNDVPWPRVPIIGANSTAQGRSGRMKVVGRMVAPAVLGW